ncbi:hypothetical protein Tco_0079270 [Tanacetum coccineum]
MESSNSNSNERELQLTQRLVKQQHSHCMAWFEQLEAHLRDLYLNSLFHAIDITHSSTLDTLEAVIHRAVITYGRLQLQSQDVQINPVQAVDDRLIVSKSSGIESENTNALRKSVNETQLQQHKSLGTESTTLEVNLNTDVKAFDPGSVIIESSRTKSDKHDTSSSSRTYITHAVDADINKNNQWPFARVTPHYLPKVREYVLTKPHHVIAPGLSKNSQEESYGSNDMAHNHYLEEARKKTQERNRNSKPSVMHTTSLQNTTNGSKKIQGAPSYLDLLWIPMGRIFKLVGLRWIPTGKMFIDSTTKVDSEPPNGSNEDITNPYECDQTLNVSAEPVVSTGTPSSTRIDQDTPSTSTSQTTQEEQSHVIPTSVEEDDHGIEVAHMDNDL